MSDQHAIFSPAFVVMLLTLAVWLYMYARRIPFITQSQLTPDQLTPAEFERLSPPHVANPSHNLKNLFELPVLFYFVCGYLFVVAEVDEIHLLAAWIFAGFRVLHSAVHCTVNIVMLRFGLYAVSSAALWFMIVRAALTHWR